MSAHADDLRYFYAEDLGATVQLAAGAGVSTPLPTGLESGRHALRILDYGGGTDVWVVQGPAGLVAAASAPAMRFLAHTDTGLLNLPVLVFMVRASGRGANPAEQRDHLAFFVTGGTGATIQITKVSRDRS